MRYSLKIMLIVILKLYYQSFKEFGEVLRFLIKIKDLLQVLVEMLQSFGIKKQGVRNVQGIGFEDFQGNFEVEDGLF